VSVVLRSSDCPSAQLWRSVREILDGTELCSLATQDGRGAVHISTAFFAWTEDLALYFLSDPTSRHARNLAEQSSAAVAVFDTHQVWGAAHRGLQLRGRAGPVAAGELRAAEQVYRRRFARYQEFRTAAPRTGPEAGFTALRFYAFATSELQVLDEAVFGPARPVLASSAARPNQRMQLTGRCGAEAPMQTSFRVAAVEALVCAPRAVTARS
jgi:uncharacterized protein YhbP (UPF0306 family)